MPHKLCSSLLVAITIVALGIRAIGLSAEIAKPTDFPELVVQSGHSEEITDIAMGPQGRLLASTSKDGTAKIWDIETGRLLRTLVYSTYWSYSAAFSPDGKLLATGSGDHVVRLWDVATGREIWARKGHVHSVTAVAFSPDGRSLATGSTAWNEDTDTFLCVVWDVKTGAAITKIPGGGRISKLLFLSDNNTLAAANSNRLILYDIASGKIKTDVQGIPNLHELKVSDDGNLLAAFGQEQIYSRNSTMKVWQLSTMNLRFASANLPASANFTPDATSQVNVTSNSVEFTDIQKGSKIRLGRMTSQGRTFSLNEMLLARISLDGSLVLLDARTSQITTKLSPEPMGIRDIKFSQTGENLAIAFADGSTTIWNLRAGKPIQAIRSDRGLVHSIAFNPSGEFISTAGFDGRIHVRDLFGRPVRSYQVPNSSPFQSQRQITQESRRELQTYKKSTAAPLPPLGLRLTDQPEPMSVLTSAFSPTKQVIAFGGSRFFVGLWNINAKDSDVEFPDFENDIAYNYVSVVTFSPDGNTLAVGDLAGRALLWDVNHHRTAQKLHGHKSAVNAAVFVPNTDLVATGGGDSSIILWDARSGKIVQNLKGHASALLSLSASPGGDLLASGSTDTSIKIWDIKARALLKSLPGHSSSVNALAFSPRGDILVSGGEDGVVRFWDVNTFSLLASLVVQSNDWLVFDPDGFFDGTRGAWGLVPFRFSSEPTKLYEPEQFFYEFFQPSLLADVLKHRVPIREILIDEGDSRGNLDIQTYRYSQQPQLRILEPKHSAVESSKHITLELEIRDTGSGLRDLRVFRNQSLIYLEEGHLKTTPGTDVYRTTVPVTITAGANEITAYVFNSNNIKSKDAAIKVIGSDRLKRSGKAYVIGIGIDNYGNDTFNLNYAVADAKAFTKQIGELLRNESIYDKVVPIILPNATKSEILDLFASMGGERPIYLQSLDSGSELTDISFYAPIRKATSPAESVAHGREILQSVEPEDVVIVYFAGHGMAHGERYHLIPSDMRYRGQRGSIDSAGIRAIVDHSISDRDLEIAFLKIAGRRLMFIIDACQSGRALESDEKRRGPINVRGLAQLAYEKNMYVLAASQSWESAVELQSLGHGLMTYVLLEKGLNLREADRAPKDSKISAREWFEHAIERVPMEQKEALERAVDRGQNTLELNAIILSRQTPVAYYPQSEEREWILLQ